ncbi:hypothetical protein ACFSTH_12390 [Paenibacillus yanchengensis]
MMLMNNLFHLAAFFCGNIRIGKTILVEASSIVEEIVVLSIHMPEGKPGHLAALRFGNE